MSGAPSAPTSSRRRPRAGRARAPRPAQSKGAAPAAPFFFGKTPRCCDTQSAAWNAQAAPFRIASAGFPRRIAATLTKARHPQPDESPHTGSRIVQMPDDQSVDGRPPHWPASCVGFSPAHGVHHSATVESEGASVGCRDGAPKRKRAVALPMRSPHELPLFGRTISRTCAESVMPCSLAIPAVHDDASQSLKGMATRL